MFQVNESRGRLCFQEREDDVGIDTIDTSTNITRDIFQVISVVNSIILYYIIRGKNTTRFYFFCRIIEGICEINMKMRDCVGDYMMHTSAQSTKALRACIRKEEAALFASITHVCTRAGAKEPAIPGSSGGHLHQVGPRLVNQIRRQVFPRNRIQPLYEPYVRAPTHKAAAAL